MSASQSGKSPDEGADLLSYAFDKGISFWDTAEMYGTYAHIAKALRRVKSMPVVSTKSYAFDRKSAEASFDRARRETGLEVIDIFMLHEQPTTLTMLGHSEALDFYIEMRDKGFIRAVGVSTHAVEPVQALALSRSAIDPRLVKDTVKEFDIGRLKEISIVHPIINMRGLGLLDGTAEDMKIALEAAHSAGIGVLGMKLFGGGNLLNDFDLAIKYGLQMDSVDSFAIGMQSTEEIDLNVRLFAGEEITSTELDAVRAKTRKLIVEEWCTGCGSCVKRCPSEGMLLVEGKATVNSEKCVLCSYCAAVCPEFAIKVV